MWHRTNLIRDPPYIPAIYYSIPGNVQFPRVDSMHRRCKCRAGAIDNKHFGLDSLFHLALKHGSKHLTAGAENTARGGSDPAGFQGSCGGADCPDCQSASERKMLGRITDLLWRPSVSPSEKMKETSTRSLAAAT